MSDIINIFLHQNSEIAIYFTIDISVFVAVDHSCDSSPCLNSGTCVNSGDSFTCICQEGYEGAVCDININDCNPYPW